MKTHAEFYKDIKKLISRQNFKLAIEAIHDAERCKKIYKHLYIELAKIYSYEGNVIDAINILEDQLQTKQHHTDRIVAELMFLYMKAGDYKKANALLPLFLNLPATMADEMQKNYITCWIKKGQNLDIEEHKKQDSYYINQLDNYVLENAIIFTYNTYSNETKQRPIIFNSNINIYTLFEEVKTIIDQKYMYPSTGIFDKYLFEVKNVSIETNGNICNYIRVMTEKNTKNILSIVPTFAIGKEEKYCFDLKKLVFEKEVEEDYYKKPISKTRIDKFNQKYNLN